MTEQTRRRGSAVKVRSLSDLGDAVDAVQQELDDRQVELEAALAAARKL